jgi:hypothetical protein
MRQQHRSELLVGGDEAVSRETGRMRLATLIQMAWKAFRTLSTCAEFRRASPRRSKVLGRKEFGLHAVADSVTLAFERHPLPAFAALAILVTQRKSLKGIAPEFCH